MEYNTGVCFHIHIFFFRKELARKPLPFWKSGMFFSPGGNVRVSFVEVMSERSLVYVKQPRNAILGEFVVYFMPLFDEC